MAEDVSASRKPLGGEDGKWPSLRRCLERAGLASDFALTVSSARDVTQTHIAGRPACDQDSQGRAGQGLGHLLLLSVEFTYDFWAKAAR